MLKWLKKFLGEGKILFSKTRLNGLGSFCLSVLFVREIFVPTMEKLLGIPLSG